MRNCNDARSVARPITPPSASTSRTTVPFATPHALRFQNGAAISDVVDVSVQEGALCVLDAKGDIYAAGGTPCVAAHSTTRALLAAYNGSLYQVRRASDNATRDIGVLATGGSANAATQDSFCAGTTCVVTVVYDQTRRGNDLWYQGSAAVPGSVSRAPMPSLAVTGARCAWSPRRAVERLFS